MKLSEVSPEKAALLAELISIIERLSNQPADSRVHIEVSLGVKTRHGRADTVTVRPLDRYYMHKSTRVHTDGKPEFFIEREEITQ